MKCFNYFLLICIILLNNQSSIFASQQNVIEKLKKLVEKIEHKETFVEEKIVLDKLIFDDFDEVSETNSIRILDKLADFVSQFGENVKIEVNGFTCNSKSPSQCLVSSTYRAEFIANYITNKSNKIFSNINIKGYGSLLPKAPNNTKENRSKNCRMEILISSSY